MGGCCGDGIPACEAEFGEHAAQSDLRRYRRKGPPPTTLALIDELGAGIDLDGRTVIDIGAGVGAVHLELLRRGATRALDIDGSSAYLAAAQGEAQRLGLADRVDYRLGDASTLGSTLPPADLVALDRVICCFGDVAGLLDAATALARLRVGLVYPRDAWWMRLAARLANAVYALRPSGYRVRVHRAVAVEARLRAAGFAPLATRVGRVWRVETWQRLPAATPA
jgi:magnesium-protoporphyrin O-methyltransferase